MNKVFKHSFSFLFILIISLSSIQGQIGGNYVYEFLNLSSSARISGIGGSFLPIKDNDIQLALSNPSLITSEMNNHLSLNFIDYFTGINAGCVTFGKTFEKAGSFVGSMQYLNYGNFTRADASGNIIGEFKASDYAMNIGWGRALSSNYSIGSNLKFIYSSLDNYFSSGLAADVAATYTNKEKQITGSVIIKNIGRQLKPYIDGNFEPLPFEIQAGITKRLAKAPIRIVLLANHLEIWDLSFEDTNNPKQTVDPLTGEKIKEKKFEVFGDKLMRHVVAGVEFLPSKNFNIRFGYNYQRRKELQVASRVAMVGFSWGFGIRISKFHIDYGRGTYHLAGSPNHISITTNLSSFASKQ